MSDADTDQAYLKLKGAREKLCLAQMHLSDADDRQEIERAIQRIDSVGSRCCPAWSVHNQTHKEY